MLLVFAVVLVLMSAPLWLAGELTGSMLPANLPVSALMVVCPLLAVLVLVLVLVHPPSWTAWQCLFTVAQRALIVWVLLNAGRCVPLAVACHAGGNVGHLLAPGGASDYDPVYPALLTSLAALLVAGLFGATLAVRPERV
jgi:hypothetical protein